MRTMDERVQKILDEVEEFNEATDPDEKDKEAIDIMHAVETFLRGHFSGREERIEVMIKTIFIKNSNRGYYEQPCF